VARLAGEARQELLAEGKPVFIIADHYGFAGEISFYLPEAREHAAEDPIVFFRSSERPQNQFYFWPGYTNRHGENAIFVREMDRDRPKLKPLPALLESQFESITRLGTREALYHGRVLRRLEIYACRGLH
jgi:hypothetical protein